MSGRALILAGSARARGRSTSESLAGYLGERLTGHGMATTLVRVPRLRRPASLAAFLEELDGAELFVLAAPLYVDALPHLVTRALERIAAHRAGTGRAAGAMLAIVNCGFPEAAHTRVALAICRAFAVRADLEWRGGLGLGGGELIGGRRLEELGWLTRNVTRALELTAAALAAGEPVPPAAVELMARPLVHPRVFTAVADVSWVQRAVRHGALLQLGARPYEPDAAER
jgi:NAD(P)H-dependent FMN reductase